MDDRFSEEGLSLIGTGCQDCRDLHAWGPGVRPLYIIHLVLFGRGTLEYGKKEFPVRAGESFLICPYDVIHYYPDPSNPWTYTWVEFAGKEAEALVKGCAMCPESPVCPPVTDSILPDLYARLQKLDYLRQNSGEANGLLRTLLGIYADAFPAPGRRSIRPDLLSDAQWLVRTNYHHSEFNVERLCRLLNVSRATLYRLFQKELGISPSSYLTGFRLQQAQLLLLRGNTVKTAALSCGFADPFYFSRLFHRQMGVSPSAVSPQI
ncbi:MAG: AraC family transcriptional regulator [Eubacteriales bacterium]|nr:AraC family transcriptional regulator [Eubacteriales bacterium]